MTDSQGNAIEVEIPLQQTEQWQMDKMSSKASQLVDTLDINKQTTIQFDGINAFVPVLNVNQQTKQGPSEKQVLYNVSGSVTPGQMLALMGPSGSGKTTLLSVVGMRAPKAIRVTGEIRFDGAKADRSNKRRLGYVMQDDLMNANLTVYETLYFTAVLRLPQTMSHDTKVEHVNQVIKILELEKVRNTIIGGFARRGVSGGERKRVAVGQELLVRPSVLLLDEPTSGLDSTTAMQLGRLLYTLAQSGRSVLTTIHQPSSRLYAMMDHVMLLSEGHVTYYGPGSRALDWFRQQGLVCPYGVNAAEFLLDVAHGDFTMTDGKFDGDIDLLIQSSEQHLANHSKHILQPPKKVVTGHSSDTDEVIYTAQDVTVNMSSSSSSDGNPPHQVVASPKAKTMTREEKWGATYSQQMYYLMIRFIRSRRFDSFSYVKILQMVAVATVAGVLWWQAGRKDTLQSAIDINGLLFFLALFASFGSMFQQLFTFPTEYNMMIKERQSGMYQLSAFYLSRMIADMPLELTVPTVYFFIIYFMGGLRLTATAVFGNWFVFLLVNTISTASGVFVGSLFKQFKSASTAGSVFLLAMMLVAGFYVRNVPKWMVWLRYVSFIHYGFRSLLYFEHNGRVYYDCDDKNENYDVGCKDADSLDYEQCCTQVTSLQESFNLEFDPIQNIGLNIGALVIYLFVLRLLAYFVVSYKTRT